MDAIREVHSQLRSAAAAAVASSSTATQLKTQLGSISSNLITANVKATLSGNFNESGQRRDSSPKPATNSASPVIGRFGALLASSGRARSPFPALFVQQQSTNSTNHTKDTASPPSSPLNTIKNVLRRRSSPKRPPLAKQPSLTGSGRPSVIDSILNTPTRLVQTTKHSAIGAADPGMGNGNEGGVATGNDVVGGGSTIEAQLKRRSARAQALGGGRKPSVLVTALEHLMPRRMPRSFGEAGGGVRGLMKSTFSQRTASRGAVNNNVLGGRKEGLGVRFKKTEIGGLEIVEDNAKPPLEEEEDNLLMRRSHRHSIVSNNSSQQRAEYEEQQDDLELIPTKFGMLNPRLYKGYVAGDDDDVEFPDDHIGRIWFALKYVQSNEQLVVKIHAIRNLPVRASGTGNVGVQCDAQVRLCLLPDERRELHTTAKSRNCNPRFFESFVFPVQAIEMPERTLRLTVCDAGNQFKVIGYAFYQFRHFDPTRDFEVGKVFRDLTPVADVKEEKPLPELFVALQYNEQREILTVTIYHGRHFSSFMPDDPIFLDHQSTNDRPRLSLSTISEHEPSLGGGVLLEMRLPRMLVKVELFHGGRMIKCKETAAVEGCDGPSFNESFQFKVKQGEIDISSVHIIVERRKFSRKHRNSIAKHAIVGSVAAAAARRISHHQIPALKSDCCLPNEAGQK